jgi:tetraacyldisaccharide 4'-kinase
VVQLRLFLYNHRIFRYHTLGCQVISVGNLTVGGTGKTPVVEVFARELQKAGRRVAILSRGYKKVEPRLLQRVVDKALFRSYHRPPRVVSDGNTLLLDSAMSGDEPYMLASNLPDVAVLVDKDRVKSGRYAINKLGCDTLILDDGFQYLALKHRVEIVLVDRTNPFGNEYVLPRGVLREPIKNIKRANFIFITKSDGTGTEDLRNRLRSLNPSAEIIECRHCPRHLQNVFTVERMELGRLKGLDIVVVSGIAVPGSFESALEQQGARILDRNRFADHHRYAQQEIIDIINNGKKLKAHAIITTEKDAVRFPKLDRWDVPVYFLRVDIEILSGAEDFHACISRICFR